MLEIMLTILGGVVVLGGVGVFVLRQRRAAAQIDEDDDARDVAPVLYVPRPRNTFAAGVIRKEEPRIEPKAEPKAEPVWPNRMVAPPMPLPRPTAGPRYLAPLDGIGMDAVVQLLPGRLEPIGSDDDQEIRFIRTPGVNKFTFGRSTGPAHTHIQLLAATASRMHAYMIIENGRWRIGNMSETNRVLVNGEALELGDADRWLHDGDRIELGEVAFVFRER
jgi:hypothetical protein